jgi:hypothetical protein
MTKQQVIERLCALTTMVGDKVFSNKYAHDCFCKASPNFQFEEEILLFIENAVRMRADDEHNCGMCKSWEKCHRLSQKALSQTDRACSDFQRTP